MADGAADRGGVSRAAPQMDTWWLDWFRLTAMWSAASMSRTYRCTLCDVTETLDPGEVATACWSCGRADALVYA